MDNLQFYVLFNSISVISGQWVNDDEKLCAMELLDQYASAKPTELPAQAPISYEDEHKLLVMGWCSRCINLAMRQCFVVSIKFSKYVNHWRVIWLLDKIFFSCKTIPNEARSIFGDGSTVQILCIGTDRSQQTVHTKIRLLLKKQSDQGLRCLPFHQHLLDALMQCNIKLFCFRTIMAIVWGVPNFRIFMVDFFFFVVVVLEGIISVVCDLERKISVIWPKIFTEL